jgi:hypothetical protein
MLREFVRDAPKVVASRYGTSSATFNALPANLYQKRQRKMLQGGPLCHSTDLSICMVGLTY